MVVAVAGATLLAGVLAQFLLVPWLRKRGVMDVPNHRSSHSTAVPRGGGIGVVISIIVGMAVSATLTFNVLVVIATSLLLAIVGLVDDFRGLSARSRLLAQATLGLMAGGLIGSGNALGFALVLGAIWMAAFVNAFNFMDGINGISAASGAVSGGSFACYGMIFHSAEVSSLGVALLAACLAFLPFNFPRARVFLGDSGSYGLGSLIALLVGLAWVSGVPLTLALAPVVIYLTDTGAALVRRLRQGSSLSAPHRSHTYQQLARSGLGHTKATLVVVLCELTVVGAAFLAYRYDLPLLGFLSVLVVMGTYLSLPSALRRAAAKRAQAR